MAWTNMLPEVINSVATRVDASNCPAGYLKDKVLWHDGNLYQCQVNIVSDTPWTDTTKLKPVVLADLSTDIRKNVAEIEDPSKTYTTGETIWESKTDLKYIDDEGNKQDVNMRAMVEAIVKYLRQNYNNTIRWSWDSENSLPILINDNPEWKITKGYDFDESIAGAPNNAVAFYGAVRMNAAQKLTVTNSMYDTYEVGVVGTYINYDAGGSEADRYQYLVDNMAYDPVKGIYFFEDLPGALDFKQPHASIQVVEKFNEKSVGGVGESYFYTNHTFENGEKSFGVAFVVVLRVDRAELSDADIENIKNCISFDIVDRSTITNLITFDDGILPPP